MKPALLFFLLLTPPAFAHLNSPDTFVQAQAGPYSFLLAAHPPATYPGALELDLRFNPHDHITQAAATVDDDPTATPIRLYDAGTATAPLWLKTRAPHTIHITVQGSTYTLQLPAPQNSTNSSSIPELRRSALHLSAYAIILLLALAFILRRHRVLRSIAVTLALVATAFFLATLRTYPGPALSGLNVGLTPGGQLQLTLTNPDPAYTFADLLPDHGKPLHLFLLREPQKDVLLHLHPTQLSAGHFITQLPSMPPGDYTVIADLYHSGPRPETIATRVTLPSQQLPALQNPDDSYANLPPLAHPNLTRTARLPDGYTLALDTAPQLHTATPYLLNVTLLDPSGKPPADMAPYLGMAAHAVVLSTIPDSPAFVFAHIHPGGTLPMLMPTTQPMPGMDRPANTPNTAAIPYGFPAPGPYRLFVQMKHGATVETAAFDLTIDSSQRE